MMNCARIHMKMWIAIKNEHKAEVQRRWDNRGKTRKAFQDWKKRVWPEYYTQIGRKEGIERGKEREKTHGIKHWGRIRTIPEIHAQVKNFLQTGVG
eukprot:2273915-Pleurochrysis_carterae.AAC.1